MLSASKLISKCDKERQLTLLSLIFQNVSTDASSCTASLCAVFLQSEEASIHQAAPTTSKPQSILRFSLNNIHRRCRWLTRHCRGAQPPADRPKTTGQGRVL